MKRLTSTCLLLLRAICFKFLYFEKHRRLDIAGAFYYSDRRLAKENHLSERTVSRAVKFLIQNSYIWAQRGLFKGRATRYKPYPAGFSTAGLKLPKGANLSAKADQQTPYKGGPFDAPKKVIKREIKNEHFESLTEEQEKERHEVFQAFIKKSKAEAKKHWLGHSVDSGEVPPCDPK